MPLFMTQHFVIRSTSKLRYRHRKVVTRYENFMFANETWKPLVTPLDAHVVSMPWPMAPTEPVQRTALNAVTAFEIVCEELLKAEGGYKIVERRSKGELSCEASCARRYCRV